MITSNPIPCFYDICLGDIGLTNPESKRIIYENSPLLAIQEIGLPITTKAVNNASIRSLSLLAFVGTIGEMLLPDFQDTDTEFERNQKTIQAQWASPHYKLVFWRRARGGTWIDRGCLPINRISGYRDLIINAFDYISDDVFEGVGHSGAIAISFEDAGAGFPRPADKIRMFGSVVHELHCYEEYKTPVSAIENTVSNVGTTAVVVAEARPSRSSFVATHFSGNGTIYLKLGTGASATNKEYTLTPGQSTPIDTIYKDVLTAIATTAGNRLKVTETLA